MDEQEHISILEEAVKAAREEEKNLKDLDVAIILKEAQDDFFQLFFSVSLEQIIQFALHVALLAIGAALAFYFMKQYEIYELEESD